MRILYFILKIFLQYPFRLFFSKVKLVNPERNFFGRTIYVSNHAASFQDPLVISVLQRPIVFFMVRSDVFKSYLAPIFWSVHMFPIYREQDGVDTKLKNEEVFKKCEKILKFGRNILIFGEGFTDDVFIRRLKPIKKGAARIGFSTLVSSNWEKKIYMRALGINYSDPNHMGGQLLISNSDKFCLNDFKELYLENPAKAISEATKRVENLLKEQITHVENVDLVFLHEHISRLKRIGLHPVDTNFSIPLKTRWNNSKNLAKWINEQNIEENIQLAELKEELDNYFALLKKLKIENKHIYEITAKNKKSKLVDIAKLIFYAPFVPLGLIHFYFPYIFVKRFAEKTFKRRVFWSSVKLMLGFLIMAIWNIPIVYLINYFLIKNGNISLIYYFIVPIFGKITYTWFKLYEKIKVKNRLKKMDLKNILEMRKKLIEKIDLIYSAN